MIAIWFEQTQPVIEGNILLAGGPEHCKKGESFWEQPVSKDIYISSLSFFALLVYDFGVTNLLPWHSQDDGL